MPPHSPAGDASQSPFPTTHWTLVHVVQGGTPEDAAKALCQRYRYPIYDQLRHRSPEKGGGREAVADAVLEPGEVKAGMAWLQPVLSEQ